MRAAIERKYKQRYEAMHDMTQLPEGSPIIFCMYSGGLDSAGMLFKLLTELEYVKYHIHVHHIHLMNSENRDKAEGKAVDETLSYLRKNPSYRPFSYSETTMKYPTFNRKLVRDVELCLIIGLSYINNIPSINHYAIGVTKDDKNLSDIRGRIERNNEIFAVLCKTGATRIFPVENYTKEEIYRFLPKELSSLSWSCRTPVYAHGQLTECGRCPTCKQLQAIKLGVDYGNTNA